MKKAVVIMLAFALSFCLLACGNSSDIPEITEKLTETIASVIGTTIDSAATVAVLEMGEVKEAKTISAKETEAVLSLIENGAWDIGATADCINDFSFTHGGKTYYYHSSCGTFNDNENQRSLSLSEEDKQTVNEIFLKVFTLLMIADEPSTAEPVTQNLLLTETYPTAAASVAANFGFKLFREAIKDETNALISPVSVITALTMTANGAKGETLEEIEKLIAPLGILNSAFMKDKLDGDGVKTANSVWVKKSAKVSIKPSFADTNKKYFGAEIFKEDFDNATLKKMNRWVSDNTDGMIKNGLEEIPSDAVMYLVNTVLFDAEWQTPFTANEISENIAFTAENGNEQKVTMLTQEMINDDVFTLGKAQGIKRKYANGYSFAAILPNEGVSISEALDSFTGIGFVSAVMPKKNEEGLDGAYPVTVSLPKFEFECKFRFGETLKKLGIPTAFSSKADFSGIADTEQPLLISEVYHSTKISLTEKGTKAGAATSVEMKCGSVAERKTIIFNRPFIYVIFKTDTGMPLFIGTVRDFEK